MSLNLGPQAMDDDNGPGHYSRAEDWGVVCQDMLQKNKWTNGATFIVGKEEKAFPFHKMIMELRSSEFAKWVDEGSWIIKSKTSFKNVQPSAFEHFLNLVYCSPNFSSLKKPSVSVEEIFEINNLATQFKILDISEECNKLFSDFVKIETVGKLYSSAKSRELKEAAFKYMEENGLAFFQSSEFLEMPLADVITLIKSDELLCPETEIWRAVIRWSSHNNSNLSEALKDLIPYVRFPIMTAQEIALFVTPLNILSLHETISIFNYIAAPDQYKSSIQFCSTKRRKNQENSHPSGSTTNNGIFIRELIKLLCTEIGTQTEKETNEDDSFRQCRCGNIPSPAPACSSLQMVPPLPSEQFKIPLPSPARSIISSNNGPNVNKKNNRVQFISPPSSDVSFSSNSLPPPRIVRVRQKVSYPPEYSNGTNGSTNQENGFDLGDNETSSRSRRNDDSDDSDSDGFENIVYETDLILNSWDSYLRRWARCNKNCPDITNLVLKNCHFESLYPKIVMPKLKKLLLDLKIPMDRRNGDQYKIFLETFDLRRFLFFTKNQNKMWKFDELWVMKIELELLINGVKFLKMSRKTGELTLGCRNNSVELLGSMVGVSGNQFKILNLVKTEIPPTRFTTYNLKEILLYKVYDYKLGYLGPFLRRCKVAEKMYLWVDRIDWDQKGVMNKVDIDFGRDLPATLKELSVAKAKLIVRSSTLAAAKKASLENLYTELCHWSPTFFGQFNELFPNLKRVSFRPCRFPFWEPDREDIQMLTKVNPRLMTNILKIKSIQYIQVWDMDWSIEDSKTSNNKSKRVLRNSFPTTEKEISTIKTLLKESGIRESAENFILEKNDEGKWEGREQINQNGSWEELERNEYNFFKLEKIYKDFETFQEYKIVDQDNPGLGNFE